VKDLLGIASLSFCLGLPGIKKVTIGEIIEAPLALYSPFCLHLSIGWARALAPFVRYIWALSSALRTTLGWVGMLLIRRHSCTHSGCSLFSSRFFSHTDQEIVRPLIYLIRSECTVLEDPYFRLK
jgi:hypothetical protein